jgi:hypothetical protein
MDYPGALGVMEMCKFYNLATDDQIALMKSLISNKKLKEVWELLTNVLQVKINHPMSLKEFLEIEKLLDKSLIEQHLQEGYEAYAVPENVRKTLAVKFPPKFPEFIGHHITNQFVKKNDQALAAGAGAKVKVYAHVEEDGLEALAVTVNGKENRAKDNKQYHITWSLDRSKGKKPFDSNKLLASFSGDKEKTPENGWTNVSGISEFTADLGYFE